jgi:methylated-DNA-[protein]-cysteine S-methyltransferase
MTTRYAIIDSPVGRLLLVEEAGSLREIRFDKGPESIAPEPGWVEGGRFLDRAKRQLEQFFKGKRNAFDLPLAPQGTEFQRSVWDELLRIPYGETISYGELAKRIGRPKASRAVGAANGQNPISIVIPCHRVIGADGSLTGFGGGLSTKRKLLKIEGARQPTGDLFASS